MKFEEAKNQALALADEFLPGTFAFFGAQATLEKENNEAGYSLFALELMRNIALEIRFPAGAEPTEPLPPLSEELEAMPKDDHGDNTYFQITYGLMTIPGFAEKFRSIMTDHITIGK